MAVSSPIQTKLFREPKFVEIECSTRLYIRSPKLDMWRKARLPRNSNYVGFRMVGRGKRTNRDCGIHYGNFSCSCGSTTKGKLKLCYEFGCPRCFHKAITRTSKKLEYRLKRLLKTWNYVLNDKRIILRHFSFNTKYPIFTIDSYRKYKSKLIRILKKEGLLGGLLFFHPYRKEEGFKTLRESSHFHCIVWGYISDYYEFKSRNGFNYSNISYSNFVKGKAKKPYISNSKHLFGLIRYLLSHSASFDNGIHSYSWIGRFSNNSNRKFDINNESSPVSCENCEDILYLIKNKPHHIDVYKGSNWDKIKNLVQVYYYEDVIEFDYDYYLSRRRDKYKLFPRGKNGINKVYYDYLFELYRVDNLKKKFFSKGLNVC